MQVALQYIAKSLFDPRLVVPKVNPDMMLVLHNLRRFWIGNGPNKSGKIGWIAHGVSRWARSLTCVLVSFCFRKVFRTQLRFPNLGYVLFPHV